ncbi:hypothetical protein ACQPWO_26885, partial [Escherichia coli]
MRDLILQLSKSSIYSTKPVISAISATASGVIDIATPATEVILKEKNSLHYMKMFGAGCSLISAGLSLGLDISTLLN